MDLKMHGKAIARVLWPDPYQQNTVLAPLPGERLYLSAIDQGDRADYWIVHERDGVELQRINPRYIERIEWAPPA